MILEIVSPEAKLFSGEVTSVTLPGVDGSFQILNNHAPIVSILEKGTVKIGGQYLNELEYQQIQDFRIENLPEGNKANNYGNYTGSMSNHDKVYDNLIDVLTHNAPITTSSYEGMKTVEIIEKIYRAAKH